MPRDHSSRVYRILERLRRCVTRVDARVIHVVSVVLGVDGRGNWGVSSRLEAIFGLFRIQN